MKLNIKQSKNKKIISTILVIALISLILGVTYAAFEFNFLGTGKNIIKSYNVSIEFLESVDTINMTNVFPIPDNNGKTQTDTFDFAVTTKANSDTSIKYKLTIEKLEVDTGYTAFNDNEVKVYLTDYDNNELVEPTLISDLGSTLYRKTNTHSITNTEIQDKYKLRVWIDYNVDSSEWDENINFQYKFKIGVKTDYNLDESGANKPILSANMIPVYYDETCDENAGCWRKADSTNSKEEYKWYNYDEKMWANSVTVSSTNRSTYLESTEGTKIPMDDILTMQVWVPRYKYKVWNYNLDGTKTSNPQEIEITFEQGTAKTGDITCTDNVQGTSDGTESGTQPTVSEICKINNEECTDDTCNNKTYTHPAFTFGNKELEGIWVGKFELSSDIPCTITGKVPVNEEGTCNVDTIRPLIKPSVKTWTGAMVSVFENNMMAMNDSDNKYGFASTDDTHMIKNMEWGAVAYLSHSKYGTCEDGECNEVTINSNSNYITGCGPQTEGSYAAGTICNSYETPLGMSSSTTGNIYGIYDMNGGLWDLTMANIVSPDGEQMMSGSSADTSYPNEHSGYDGILYYNGTTPAGYGTYDGEYSYPDNKYIDKYSFNTSNSTRSRSKLGDGIREVLNSSSRGWYRDTCAVPVQGASWFARGGAHINGDNAGIFYSDFTSGCANEGPTSRLVISQ